MEGAVINHKKIPWGINSFGSFKNPGIANISSNLIQKGSKDIITKILSKEDVITKIF